MPVFLGGLHNSAGITPAAFNKLKSKYMIEDTRLVCKKKIFLSILTLTFQ